MNLLHLIQDTIRKALTGYVDDVEAAAALVKPTQDSKHGDYQANCAMSLAKKLRKKPRDIAAEIVERLQPGEVFQEPELGP